METALWVPVADAEPHGIYSNVTAWASWESQCLTVTPFFKAWLFLNVVQHPQDWIWFVKPMSCMVAVLLSSSFSPHVSLSPREKKRQVSDVSGEGRRGLLGAGQPRGTARALLWRRVPVSRRGWKDVALHAVPAGFSACGCPG